jgi:N utilization substance protein B
MEANNISIQKVLLEFEKHRDVENQHIDFYSKADLIFLRKIIETTIKNQETIDKNITQSIKKDWTMDRIDPTLRAIFRAASAEFIIQTPPKIVISEFLEIAKSFFPNGKECKLANGVLDKLATQILSI